MLVEDYLGKVITNIKSKEAKAFVKLELSNHLHSVIKEREKNGISKETAEQDAIKSMGDAYLLGTKLNRLHRPSFDWLLFIIFILLIGLSFLPFLHIEEINYLNRKLIYSAIGLLICLFCIFFDYRRLAPYGYVFFALGVVFLVFIGMSSTVINGTPYILVAGVSIEGTYALPLFLVAWASLLQQGVGKWWIFTPLYIISVLLLLPTSNLFLVFLYTALVVGMAFFGQQEKRDKLISALMASFVAMIIFVYKLFTEKILIERIQGFFRPEEHSSTTGYMILKARMYLSEAGWLGEGKSVDNSFFIPEAYTDFIFVTLIHKYGWLIGALLLLVLILLAVRMVSHLKTLQEPFGRLLTIGAVILYTLTFSWSVLMALGILPIVRVGLPFFTYGLMPVVLHSFLIGVVMSVYRRKNFVSIINKG